MPGSYYNFLKRPRTPDWLSDPEFSCTIGVGIEGRMRRKLHSKTEPVVPPEILEKAKQSLSTDKFNKTVKCVVCGAETTAEFAEQLCWVCRRLKISAWRDTEQQMPIQE